MPDTTSQDPNVSTRTVLDVRRHRNRRVADILRKTADRLEADDVLAVTANFNRKRYIDTDQLQYGGLDDYTLQLAATLQAPEGTECPEAAEDGAQCHRNACPYCAWRVPVDNDPED